MIELLNEKLAVANEMKDYTKKLMELSLKTDYDKLNLLIDERQTYMEKIDRINEKISLCDDEANFEKTVKTAKTSEIKLLKKEIRDCFKEISEMDNTIRKSLHIEISNLRKTLNHSETSTNKLNIKA